MIKNFFSKPFQRLALALAGWLMPKSLEMELRHLIMTNFYKHQRNIFELSLKASGNIYRNLVKKQTEDFQMFLFFEIKKNNFET